MKLLIVLICLYLPVNIWLNNIEDAKSAARASHKMILINFSGSDWCIPCIRFKNEVLESQTFSAYAEENLVLLRADFPRLKKNLPSKEQVKINEALAEKYNPNGVFPLTLLLNEDGKIIGKWEGYPNISSTQFVAKLASLRDSSIKQK